MQSILRRVGIAGVLIAVLPSLTMAATVFGAAYGNSLGTPFHHTPGGLTSCSYGNGGNSQLQSGSCGYTTTGLIGQQVQGGPDWTNQTDLFFTHVASSFDPGGNLHAVATAQFSNEPVDINFIHDNLQGSSAASADAYAYSYDMMTWGNAIPIQVVFNVSLDGTFFNQDPQEALGNVTFNVSAYYNGANHSTGAFLTTGGTYNYQITALVNPGATIQYGLYIQTHVQLACTAQFGTHLCNANESVDFSNTAQLTGITVKDLSGNVLSGYTATSQSGFNYNSLVQGAAPEPGGMLLAAGGLALCLIRRRVK